MNRSKPAILALLEGILSRLAGPEAGEAILGDLYEDLGEGNRPQGGPSRLRLMGAVLFALPPLLAAGLRRHRARKEAVPAMDQWTSSQRRIAAVVGAVACLPASLLVVGGLLQNLLGTPQVLAFLDRTLNNDGLAVSRLLRHPAVVLGGLVVAGLVNLLPLLRLGLSRMNGTVMGTLAIRLRGAQLAVGSMAAVLLAVILAYGFTENYTVTPRRALVPLAVQDTLSPERAAPPPGELLLERVLVRVDYRPCWALGSVLHLESAGDPELTFDRVDCVWVPAPP